MQQHCTLYQSEWIYIVFDRPFGRVRPQTASKTGCYSKRAPAHLHIWIDQSRGGWGHGAPLCSLGDDNPHFCCQPWIPLIFHRQTLHRSSPSDIMMCPRSTQAAPQPSIYSRGVTEQQGTDLITRNTSCLTVNWTNVWTMFKMVRCRDASLDTARAYSGESQSDLCTHKPLKVHCVFVGTSQWYGSPAGTRHCLSRLSVAVHSLIVSEHSRGITLGRWFKPKSEPGEPPRRPDTSRI